MFGLSKKERLLSSLKKYEANGGVLLADEEFFIAYDSFNKGENAESRLMKAVKWGHVHAVHFAYMLIEAGRLQTLSSQESESIFRQAVNNWEPNALMKVAVNANLNGDTSKAVQYFTMASIAGHPGAASRLASLWEGKNATLFKYWLVRLIAHGSESEQEELKRILKSTLNESEKVYDPCSPEYQNWVARSLFSGNDASQRPFEINYTQIIRNAADAGSIPAMMDTIILLQSSDDKKSEILEFCAKKGVPESMCEYGKMLLSEGKKEAAGKYLLSASMCGYGEASLILGNLCEKNNPSALENYLRAASSGNYTARTILSTCPYLNEIHREYFRFLSETTRQ